MKQFKKIIPYFIKKILNKVYLYIIFLKDFILFKKKTKEKSRFKIKWNNRLVQLFDKTNETRFDAHYVYHPAWAARIIKKNNPEKHIDISSTLNFSSMLSAFLPVEFYDYRPANLKLSNLTSKKADLTDLPFESESIKSLSCMHTIEHIGLGRYGDPIDPDGDVKAMSELSRVLSLGGDLLFVVPIGKATVRFNAHRIYSYDQIISYFPNLTLKEFSLIPDSALNTGMVTDATKEQANIQSYGCGCFWFKKVIYE